VLIHLSIGYALIISLLLAYMVIDHNRYYFRHFCSYSFIHGIYFNSNILSCDLDSDC
jgi:hypothetical protein